MTEPPTGDELRLLAAAARRVARARGADEHAADDIAQETVSRVLAVSDRLEPSARLPYALTTAGNLVVNLRRAAERAGRHQHRLADFEQPVDPESALLALEQAAAVRSALNELTAQDRLMFVRHSQGASTADLAAATSSTPAAVAARLARTRARLRLDYLLALRRILLPSLNCRRVLLAVSAADLRRQQALNVAAHLTDCPTCVSLIPPLVQRRSALAAIVAGPLVALGGLGGRIGRAARSHVVQATAGVTAVAVAAWVLAASGTHRTAATVARTAVGPVTRPPSRLVSPVMASIHTAGGVNLVPVPAAETLENLVGQRVIVHDVLVQSVVSHPGFWIGLSGNQRLYVHLDKAQFARDRIMAGRHVSFVARLERNSVNYSATDGVSTDEGAALLNAQGVHLTADATRVTQT